jgi:hypothetical protein
VFFFSGCRLVLTNRTASVAALDVVTKERDELQVALQKEKGDKVRWEYVLIR